MLKLVNNLLLSRSGSNSLRVQVSLFVSCFKFSVTLQASFSLDNALTPLEGLPQRGIRDLAYGVCGGSLNNFKITLTV